MGIGQQLNYLKTQLEGKAWKQQLY
jgi:hypothetical protein